MCSLGSSPDAALKARTEGTKCDPAIQECTVHHVICLKSALSTILVVIFGHMSVWHVIQTILICFTGTDSAWSALQPRRLKCILL